MIKQMRLNLHCVSEQYCCYDVDLEDLRLFFSDILLVRSSDNLHYELTLTEAILPLIGFSRC